SRPQFDITVKRVEGKKLIQPTITIPQNGTNPATTLRSAEGELHFDGKAQGVYIICRDVNADVEGKLRINRPGKMSYFEPIARPEGQAAQHHRDWVAMRAIPEHIAELKAEFLPLERERLALKAQGRTLPEAEATRLADLKFKINRLRTEPFCRLSNGFTCLCFVLVGVPVAMFWRHSDVLTNFFVCFAPILSIYYPLLMLGEDLSTSGKLPPISFWMGNTLFLAAGILLIRRIVRH
ncbi:MAG: LptF/LptG family permease, partial [Thermoguttaceae bacterium]